MNLEEGTFGNPIAEACSWRWHCCSHRRAILQWSICYNILLLLLFELGLLRIFECRLSLSDRENRFPQPGDLHAQGFSLVCVRM